MGGCFPAWAVPPAEWPEPELRCCSGARAAQHCSAPNASFPSAISGLARAAEQPSSTFLCNAEPGLFGKGKGDLIPIFQIAESVSCISFTPSKQKWKANVASHSAFPSLFWSTQMSANPALTALLKISTCQQMSSFPLVWSYLFIAEKVCFYIKISSLDGNLSGRVKSRHAMLCTAVSLAGLISRYKLLEKEWIWPALTVETEVSPAFLS